ncbi:MAG: hypothetical protein J0M13_07690 [Candidatus Accumulibacter sp.]|jgi:hypothetical protein|nr:hypothetical protein [Candidatus Accumulibacter necessarius]
MKTSGLLLLAIGLIWVAIAFNIDTTVTTDGQFVGGSYYPGKSVHNIGKMDERRNHLMIASLLVIVGVVLFAFGSTGRTKSATSVASPAPVSDNEDYKNSRYNGERNIASGKYQLFLTKKYAIEKNATLEKYVVEDNLFETLEQALEFCDNKEKQAELERLRTAYKVEYFVKNSNADLAGVQLGDFLVAYNRKAIASNMDMSDAIASLSEPTTTLVVFRDGKALVLKVSAGALGIDGRFEELDPATYALRVRKAA